MRGRLDRGKGAFDLGRLEVPVAVGALAWSAVAVFVLVAPAEAFVPALIAALETEPGGML
ncbi:hypothetical protein HTZ77_05760 [Nonomuraea sp. SMC257]|uniref:Uncharacterized protein n=1 Tax=Nonomuraea montanisoli TaxID=2741721 RepID=A0A7Y6I5M9_9ACTN|nr:hypothetical protein [Nonomuraea montanisoli]NUW30924.1 hypothetical protein [Nonomuraea montanisoli]